MSYSKDEAWLAHSKVSYKILEKNSRWHVYLVFKGPGFRQYLSRYIANFRSYRLAEIYGQNAVRTADKDFTSFREDG